MLLVLIRLRGGGVVNVFPAWRRRAAYTCRAPEKRRAGVLLWALTLALLNTATKPADMRCTYPNAPSHILGWAPDCSSRVILGARHQPRGRCRVPGGFPSRSAMRQHRSCAPARPKRNPACKESGEPGATRQIHQGLRGAARPGVGLTPRRLHALDCVEGRKTWLV